MYYANENQYSWILTSPIVVAYPVFNKFGHLW